MKKSNILKSILGIVLLSSLFATCKDKEAEETCPKKTYYADADGDGLGSPYDSIMECELPKGYVENNDDNIDQNPTRQAVPMLFKVTGETCGPCGGWGWKGYEEIVYKYKEGKAFTWANYGSGFSSGLFRSQEINPTMDAIQNRFAINSPKPSFVTNNVNHDGNPDNKDAMKAADAFYVTQAPVGIVMNAKLTGDKLTIHAKAEAFSKLDGIYLMGAYLVEDKVVGPQAGDAGANGDPEHHNVMRGSLSKNAWGEVISDNGITVGNVYEKTFSIDVPKSYNKANFSYGIIVWERRISTHYFINACTTQ